jgi:diguanylate cyclase (GGDEF)-like protein
MIEANILDFRKLKYYRHNSLILVVSGDRQLTDSITAILASQKYNCIAVNNGTTAWETILKQKPAIVLADWATPDISGLALCHRLKANIEQPDLNSTYFMLMVEDQQQQYQIGLETGTDEFVSNRINAAELKIRIRNALRSSALIQSLTWTNQRLLAQNDLLDALSLSDPLTRVLSEQAFANIIPRMMQQFRGYGNYQGYGYLSVLIVDIDRFRQVTAAYGEKIGNEAIRAIAGRLTHNCAANSLIYRHGLDEFVCVTPHSSAAQGSQTANDLLASIRSHPIAVSSGLLFPLTISIGGITIALENGIAKLNALQPSPDKPDFTFDDLVILAERSLLQAQQSGGDRAFVDTIS